MKMVRVNFRGEKTLDYLKSQSYVNPHSGCWEWQRGKTNIGYGQVWFRGKVDKTHRAAFLLAKGDIPNDKEIDHLCFNRSCINPEHLRLASHQENCAYRATRNIRCKRGHEFTSENTFSLNENKARGCKTCRYLRVKEWRARHPEEARRVWREAKAKVRGRNMQALVNMPSNIQSQLNIV